MQPISTTGARLQRAVGFLFGVLFLGLQPNAFAQNGAADFNGTSGYLEAPGAGSLLTGGSGITLAGWVYPRNAFPSYPDFDGFFGFRNDFSFDFYILQLSGTDVEVRFKNSLGVDYDIVSSTVQLNQWQHMAMTYDGSTLRYYYDGVLESSIPASGTYGSIGQAFRMGRITWTGGPADFYMDGQLDNVQVWNRALSDAEIADLHCREDLDAATYPGLVLHYRLNDTTGTTAADDAVDNIDATVNGGVSWVSSTVMLCAPPYMVSTALALCDGDSALLGGGWQSLPGSYTDTLLATDGLDSIVTTTLSFWPLPAAPAITQLNDTTLQSSTALSYQWFRNDTLLTGATDQSLINPLTGAHTVVVTDTNGCSSASAVFNYFAPPPPNGLNVLNGPQFSLFPTISTGLLTLDYTGPEATLSITGLDGRLIRQVRVTTGRQTLDCTELERGWYIVQLAAAAAISPRRIYID